MAEAQTAARLSIGKPGTMERRRFMEAFDRQYHPCENGLHVVGIDDDTDLPCGPHFTVLNIDLAPQAARSAFDGARQAFAAPDDEGDVLVDLMIAGSVEDNFWMRRQMVEVMQREAQET